MAANLCIIAHISRVCTTFVKTTPIFDLDVCDPFWGNVPKRADIFSLIYL